MHVKNHPLFMIFHRFCAAHFKSDPCLILISAINSFIIVNNEGLPTIINLIPKVKVVNLLLSDFEINIRSRFV